jgi:phosphoglycerate dehydrogenase-like enzyme
MGILVHTEPLPDAVFADAVRAVAGEIPVWTTADAPPAEAVEAILAWRLKAGFLPRYPNLRVVCSIGAGVEKLLVPDLPASVAVTRVVDPRQSQAIARYVVACALQHLAELPRYRAQQAEARWDRHAGRPPEACRIGLLGLGSVGQAVARGFVALGLPVAAWVRRARADEDVEVFAGDAALPALLARSDVLVCTLPLTPATEGLLNRRTLSQLPAGAYLINVGRGGHLVEPDLLALLDEGHLGGAALDVFHREPLPADSPLWRHPRVLATPHIAGAPGFDVVATACVDALRRARAGREQPLAVDRRIGY